MKRLDDTLFLSKEHKIVADDQGDSNFLKHLYTKKPETS